MKSMRPPLAAIFFMTYFHRAGEGEGHGPLGHIARTKHGFDMKTLSFH